MAELHGASSVRSVQPTEARKHRKYMSVRARYDRELEHKCGAVCLSVCVCVCVCL